MMENFAVKLLVIISAIVTHTYGLQCWTCENARGSKDCMENGRLKTCKYNELKCYSEVRNNNGRWEITKRCKQPNACENNHIQNPRDASILSQCNPFIQGSVCRCCCGFSGCNKKGLFCLDQEPKCRTVPRPLNGYVKCQFTKSASEVGSVCRFFCNKGYNLEGASESTCVKTLRGNPRFDRPAPVCKVGAATQCQTSIESLENGDASCSAGTSIGSVCKYTCNLGFDLSGPSSVTCGQDGKWSDTAPSCAAPKTCVEQTGIANGLMLCNQDGKSAGTTCGFTCNPGYFLTGEDSNRCVEAENGLAWSRPAPTCEPIICVPEQTAPEGGSVDCKTNTFGTVCTFTCDDGAMLLGSETTECVEDFGPLGKWSEPTPECLADFFDAPAVTCAPVEPVENGDSMCSDENNVASDCIFFCNPGFRNMGEEVMTCMDDGTWSNAPPKCSPLSCEEQAPIKNGNISCVGGDELNSVCQFSCKNNDGRVLNPAETTQNECIMQADGTVGWYPPPPCCGLPCPPNVLMDLVVVLDSSSSVKPFNWDRQVKFTKLVLEQFTLGEASAQMSIFRFNSDVDEETEIKFSDSRGKTMEELMIMFDKIPYNGSGTRTGRALRHVQKKSLSVAYGNRPHVQDVVLVITDGKAQNPKLVKQVSKELRDSGVLIYAVGIGLKEATYKKLVKMTDDEERAINVKDFEKLLSGGFSEKLGANLCHDPCA